MLFLETHCKAKYFSWVAIGKMVNSFFYEFR